MYYVSFYLLTCTLALILDCVMHPSQVLTHTIGKMPSENCRTQCVCFSTMLKAIFGLSGIARYLSLIHI